MNPASTSQRADEPAPAIPCAASAPPADRRRRHARLRRALARVGAAVTAAHSASVPF